jgi:RNA 3'-terminal phosphate cyclase (ATP)
MVTRQTHKAESVTIDGTHGEGGGQILRTALALSAITSRTLHIVNVRAKRPKPGLLPQHLSAARAAASITGAMLQGDQLGSGELVFAPRHPAKPGYYLFDVAEIAGRGSAGSSILILQTILLPLALVQGRSELVVRGGTHLEWAPAYDDFANVYLRALRLMGLEAEAELASWGWYPAGGGEVRCLVPGAPVPAPIRQGWPRPINLLDRGSLRRISGRAVAANLHINIAERMGNRARGALGDLAVPIEIEALTIRAACPGAGIFLLAEYEGMAASFSAYGRRGKPSEAVADEAIASLREHHASGASFELHLADQMLVPFAIAAGPSHFTTARPTAHLTTNAWTIEQFGIAKVTIKQDALTHVWVEPSAASRSY